MPIRIQPNRPYYSRYYLPRGRVGAPSAGAGRGGRAAPGGGIDTSSTGNIGGDIVKAIGNQIQMNRQNAAANQILNTQTPPRAGWVGGTAPAAGVSTTGTPPQTGGVGELQMRQQQNQADLENALQQAKIKAALALAAQRTGRTGGGDGGNASRWQQYLGGGGAGGGAGGAGGKKGGKGPQFVAGQYDANIDARADKFGQVAADFDDQYGGKAYAKVAPYLSTLAPVKDDKGNITGYTIGDPQKPTMSLTPDDAKLWASRINAARVAAGQTPYQLPSELSVPSANPTSGQSEGTEVNPYKPTNQLEARSLPYNSYFINPDTGQVGQKLPEGKQQPPPTGQKTSQVDTGDQGQQVAQADQDQSAQQPPATTGGFSLASGAGSPVPVPVPAPAPMDMSIGVGLDRTGGAAPADTGSQSLADAIARAKAQNQLQGVT